VRWLDIAGGAEVPPPPEPPAAGLKAKDAPELIVRGGLPDEGRRLTGRGVVVAIVDSGVDFRHPDFVRVQDGKRVSRLVAFWDTTREHTPGVGLPGPFTYPGGAPIGTVFSQEELTADLSGRRLGDLDVDGHGTACAGVAVGNGAALQEEKKRNPDRRLAPMDYTGVAPEADLIAVRVGDVGPGIRNAWLFNCACDWVDRVAGGRPAVVSYSVGGHSGGHDGSRIAERWVARQLPAGRAGRLVFVAAGNEGARKIHGSTRFDRDRDGRLTWDLREAALIEVYIDPDGQAGSVTAADVAVAFTAGTKARLGKAYVHGLSNSLVVPVIAQPGRGGLNLTAKAGKPLQADAYIPPNRGQFTGASVSPERQVATPATSGGVLAVGSYDFNPEFLGPKGLIPDDKMDVGKLSGYSNPGYYRRGAGVKPDLVAPGQIHTAPAPTGIKNRDIFPDLTGRYQLFDGTSAATPYAAGVAALLLEKRPKLTADEFRRLVQAHATSDRWTLEHARVKANGKDLPNIGWGHGKLDLAAVRKMVAAVPVGP
jgi:subtilisin family serine protease